MKNKNKSIFRTRYRIIENPFLGWEVQYKPWYCPFWIMLDFSNCFSTAKYLAERHSNKIYLDL